MSDSQGTALRAWLEVYLCLIYKISCIVTML